MFSGPVSRRGGYLFETRVVVRSFGALIYMVAWDLSVCIFEFLADSGQMPCHIWLAYSGLLGFCLWVAVSFNQYVLIPCNGTYLCTGVLT